MMSLEDCYYLIYVGCGAAVAYFAARNRCRLLLIGFSLRLVVDIQVLFVKLLRALGHRPEGPAPAPLALLNRALAVGSLLLITVSVIRLLQHQDRIRACLPPKLPKSEITKP